MKTQLCSVIKYIKLQVYRAITKIGETDRPSETINQRTSGPVNAHLIPRTYSNACTCI